MAAGELDSLLKIYRDKVFGNGLVQNVKHRHYEVAKFISLTNNFKQPSPGSP